MSRLCKDEKLLDDLVLKDFTVVLKAHRRMSLETCLDYINSDELVEVTPTAFRMRKRILNTTERKKYDSHQRSDKNE